VNSRGMAQLTRRRFLRVGSASLLGASVPGLRAQLQNRSDGPGEAAVLPEYLTREENFKNVGRGKPPPGDLSEPRRREAGLTPETWQLEVVADTESDSKLDRPLAKAQGTALTWEALMKLAETRAVRFLHVMACTNMTGPLGLGLWEGVPLREVLWRARPAANVRRVFYHGYHNEDPQQRFQSSLTLDRVLEDPPGEWPVILCYKLNGQWLTPKRGGPVRLIVPGLYGNKSVKWLQRVVLTNNPRLNDTYAEWNNDTESPLKTCAFLRDVPEKVRAGRPVAVTGLAQVGMAGLRRVEYFLQPQDPPWPADDPYFSKAEWRVAKMLPPPAHWGGGLPGGKLPAGVLGFGVGGAPL
jgi:DMSO/TMAO reductase YedYZ molybdopterin-dependent catalytic subunit